MFWFSFLILFGFICVLFPCQGVVFPPSSGDKITFLPGSTEKIKWTFDDTITSGDLRSWSFTSTDGFYIKRTIARIVGDGNATTFTNFPVIAVEKPATLVLKNVNHSYDGKYNFLYSGVKSNSFFEVFVFIAEKPNTTLNCPSLVTLKEGDDFTCQCKGEGGNPPANVTWFKDGVKMTDVGTEKQILNFTNVGGADNGTYKCVATSYPHENYTDEKSVQVIVRFSPTNTVIKFSLNPAVFNQSLNVTCTSDGFPELTYIIKHNGTRVTSGNRLVIKYVKWENAGTYKCIANNSLGNDSHSDFLNVTDVLTNGQEPKPTTQSIKSSTNKQTLSTTAGMETNLASTTAYISIFTATCTPIFPSTTSVTISTPPTGKNQEDYCSETEWYIVVVTLVSGIIIGIILSYIVFRFHKKNRKPQLPNPQPSTSPVDKTYQELDFKKMNKEDNYQSLRMNAAKNKGVDDDESNYTELKKFGEVENNYQSLT